MGEREMIHERTIYITDYDLYRLRLLLDASVRLEGRNTQHLRDLKDELDRAQIIKSSQIPPNVITMNSRFLLRDLETDQSGEYTLVFPGRANHSRGMISIVTPIGTALLGRREFDRIEFDTPAGRKRFQILDLVYQPEAAEQFHL